MKTGSRVKLDRLEALRGIAALVVVLHHAFGIIALPGIYGIVLLGNIFGAGHQKYNLNVAHVCPSDRHHR